MTDKNKSVMSTHITDSSRTTDDRWCLHHYDTEEEANRHRVEMIGGRIWGNQVWEK